MDINAETPWQKDLPQEFTPMQSFAKKDSLAASLKKIPATLSVHLLGLEPSTPLIDEEPYFFSVNDSEILAREVIIKLNQQPVVFARSICHKSSENWTDILDRGNRPLVDKLFNGSLPISRSKFEYRVMLPTPYLSLAPQLQVNLDLCLARRSVFWLEDKPLLLTEIFLPSFQPFL